MHCTPMASQDSIRKRAKAMFIDEADEKAGTPEKPEALFLNNTRVIYDSICLAQQQMDPSEFRRSISLTGALPHPCCSIDRFCQVAITRAP